MLISWVRYAKSLHSLVIRKCVTTKSFVRLSQTDARLNSNAIEIDVVCPFDTSSNSYVLVLPDKKSVKPAAAYLRVSTPGASKSVNLLTRSLYQFVGEISLISGNRINEARGEYSSLNSLCNY